MRRRTWVLALLVSIGLGSCVAPKPIEEEPRTVQREPTLRKIAKTGIFAVGTRPDAPPFSILDRKGEYQGFSIDLARMVHKQIEREVGRLVELKFVPVSSVTRIPRLLDGSIDMIAEVMTYTRERDRLVDFSIIIFVTGQQLLVPADSPIQKPADLIRRRVGALKETTSASTIQKVEPRAELVLFESAPLAFEALQANRIDAYTSDGVILAGLKTLAGHPADWEVVGELLSYEPYALAMRENDSRFRDLVNHALMEALQNREYIALYNKWLGPSGLVPYPIPREAQTFLLLQAVPPS